MSFFIFRQECHSCFRTWNAQFGMVNNTLIAEPPKVCPYCQSDKVVNPSITNGLVPGAYLDPKDSFQKQVTPVSKTALSEAVLKMELAAEQLNTYVFHVYDCRYFMNSNPDACNCDVRKAIRYADKALEDLKALAS